MFLPTRLPFAGLMDLHKSSIKKFREMRNCDKTTRNFPRGKWMGSKFKWILQESTTRFRVRKAATNGDDLIESEFEWNNKERKARKEITRIGSRRLRTIFITISASTLMFLEVNTLRMQQWNRNFDEISRPFQDDLIIVKPSLGLVANFPHWNLHGA